MSFLPLFDDHEQAAPQAARLAPKLHALAARGVYFGTSSWKYDGWLGSLYNSELYSTRGKFSQKKFESACLSEYARVFPVVCGDFAFYQFPSADYWRRLFESAPAPFLFAFKVPEQITVAKWPAHARYGPRAGKDNESFLNIELFRDLFARPLAHYSNQVAALIFEFGTFAKSVFANVDHFLDRLDPFLASLPIGFRYSIEIRNPEYLGPSYFSTLAHHGVAHVFNAWTRMPELAAQLELPGAFGADFTVARALLTRGRSYEEAVRTFEPYKEVKAPNTAVREELRSLAERAVQTHRPAFLFVNNRLEGNAPTTIEGVVDELV